MLLGLVISFGGEEEKKLGVETKIKYPTYIDTPTRIVFAIKSIIILLVCNNNLMKILVA